MTKTVKKKTKKKVPPKPVIDIEESSDIESTVEEVKKEAKSKKKKKKKLRGNAPSGMDLVDLVIGGGYPYGYINIVGDSSSGKSFLAGEFIAMCYHHFGKNGFDWFYDDAEKGYRFNSQKLYGIDILNDGFLNQKKRSHTIEDFERNIYHIIEKKEPKRPFVYVIDSWDSLTSEAELAYREKKRKSKKKDSNEEESGKKESGTYNLAKQKEGHAFFRTTIQDIEENNIILVIISQVKEKIGISFGRSLYRTGGKALDFYANIVFWLAQAEIYKKKKRAVGFCMKVQGTKTRNENPFRECYVDLLFDYGVDNISSNLKFLYDLKTDKGKDSDKARKGTIELEWDGEIYKMKDLIKFIEDNDLENELKQRVVDKWNEIEESISSKHRKRKWQK